MRVFRCILARRKEPTTHSPLVHSRCSTWRQRPCRQAQDNTPAPAASVALPRRVFAASRGRGCGRLAPVSPVGYVCRGLALNGDTDEAGTASEPRRRWENTRKAVLPASWCQWRWRHGEDTLSLGVGTAAHAARLSDRLCVVPPAAPREPVPCRAAGCWLRRVAGGRERRPRLDDVDGVDTLVNVCRLARKWPSTLRVLNGELDTKDWCWP